MNNLRDRIMEAMPTIEEHDAGYLASVLTTHTVENAWPIMAWACGTTEWMLELSGGRNRKATLIVKRNADKQALVKILEGR